MMLTSRRSGSFVLPKSEDCVKMISARTPLFRAPDPLCAADIIYSRWCKAAGTNLKEDSTLELEETNSVTGCKIFAGA